MRNIDRKENWMGSTVGVWRTGLKPRLLLLLLLSHFSPVQLFATLWTVSHQAPLSMGFSWQKCWSGKNLSSARGSSPPRDQTPVSCVSCITGRFFTTESPGNTKAIFPKQKSDHITWPLKIPWRVLLCTNKTFHRLLFKAQNTFVPWPQFLLHLFSHFRL